jgi:glycosyltransferase involved in cell wall biosynthesis
VSAPSLSVIVATRNAGAHLDTCLSSVAAQSLPSIEVIVADGGSTDSTRAILENSPTVTQWFSQPDRGVYDAWNHALDIASGQFVCFLGADDSFARPDVAARLVAAGEAIDADLICSRVALVDAAGSVRRVVGEPYDPQRLLRNQVVAHPGLVHRRQLFETFGPFDASLRIAGDYEFLLRLGDRVSATFVDMVSVNMGLSGASHTRLTRVLAETRRIQAAHPKIGPARATMHFAVDRAKASARRLARRA